jgi:hypothetical protein
VNYRFDLPKSLLPGSYLLQLTQTDMHSDQTTSGSHPFTIRAKTP